jgi:uncharacterized Zn-binding protein involved in type VI secretion
MPGIVRANVDKHVGHACPDPKPFHQTPYSASVNTKVYIEGNLAIVLGDFTSCGDPVVGKSSKVLIGGQGVHRAGDATGGHACWVPNSAASGSSKVIAG